MPAIQPDLLKRQSARLVQTFADPQVFLRQFEDLLEFYADRARRPGLAGAPPPLLPAYQPPRPVLRQIVRDLAPLIARDPQHALVLADRLWEAAFLESRLLAIEILAQMDVPPAEPIVERVTSWATPNQEEQLLQPLLQAGTAPLRAGGQEAFLKMVRDWLSGPDPGHQALGLRALVPLVADQTFPNLPLIFRLVQPLVQRAPIDLLPYLEDLIAILARRSPHETAYFLRQSLPGVPQGGTTSLVRGCIAMFPPELQASLRQALKSASL